MARRWLALLVVLSGALIAIPVQAQPDDDPYAEPPTPPAAKPPAAKPPAAKPPAPKPPAPKPPAAKPPAAKPPPPPPPPPPEPPPAVTPTAPRLLEPAPTMVPHEPVPAEPIVKPTPTGHGDAHGSPSDHKSDHEGDHKKSAHADHGPGEINWIYGFLGKDKDAEPSLLWRKPDMPPPFAAMVINFAVFAYILVRFGKKPIQEALVNRRKTIMKDIDAAQKMKEEASKRLATYQDKLKHIDDEIERIKKDFREQGERDRERIVANAKETRERMLKDAQFMIEQEAKQVRIDLMQSTVQAAVTAAEDILKKKVSNADQDRVAEAFLKEIGASRALGVTKGGSA